MPLVSPLPRVGPISWRAACITWLTVFTASGGARADEQGVPAGKPVSGRSLENTRELTLAGDLAEQMVAGVDRFLLRELDESITRRAAHWQRDFSSREAYSASVEVNRRRLARMLGMIDERVPYESIELMTTRARPALVGRGQGFEVFAVRWPALQGMHGEGLLLEPTARPPRAAVVLVGDCEQLPEALAGLTNELSPASQFARRLAESGCRVVVPLLINRGNELSVIAGGKRRSTANHREILYRSAYQMGRHLVGYEVQKILAVVDWFASTQAQDHASLGVVGYGEGGLLALHAAALDPRIAVCGVSGYFQSRQGLWREPIDRNLFGFLRDFGDAELASLIVPRSLLIEACAAPELVLPPGGDGAPAELKAPELADVRAEVDRARALCGSFAGSMELVESDQGTGPFGSEPFLQSLLARLGDPSLAPLGKDPEYLAAGLDLAARHARQFQELADFSQRLVDAGPEIRAVFQSDLVRAKGLDAFTASAQAYHSHFRHEIVVEFDQALLHADARTRLAYDEPAFRGYEVVLDVFPDVILYGILLVPKNLGSDERRPVVVCQHGLEGRAQFTVEGDYTSYRGFAARLAQRGFVTFSPQHLYRGGDQFRTLQRKANPLKKSLFSIMVAQHRQLLAWLGELPFVDRERIAFYGISYGGKSAMRIPAVLDGYCLSICSSDFSDWIWRTVSNRFESGYLAHSEYEIFEFDLGRTFNYADLAALICPRPFMVEDFHGDGMMAERTRGEYARVRLLYENLGIADRVRFTYYPAFLPSLPYAERETFEFLSQQLKWPP